MRTHNALCSFSYEILRSSDYSACREVVITVWCKLNDQIDESGKTKGPKWRESILDVVGVKPAVGRQIILGITSRNPLSIMYLNSKSTEGGANSANTNGHAAETGHAEKFKQYPQHDMFVCTPRSHGNLWSALRG